MSDSQSSQDQIKQYLDLLNQQIRQPAAMPTGTPDDGSSPSWTGLLGRALSGGQAPGYQLRGSQADTSGNRALLNFGVNMLLASGPHAVRPDLLSAAATGLQGAQESLGQDQQRAAQLAAAQYGATRQQQQDRLAALKEALPLLTLQQQQASLTALKGGGTATAAAPGTGDGGFTGDKEKDRALIVQRESHGDPTAMNYVAKEDPTAWDRGATATGKYQFVTSTWQEGLKLAGIDPSKYPRAMDAPESVQDQVFDAVYAKHGNKPWVKGAKDWVKDENGKYQLATVRPQAGGATPPATPGATPPPAAPPAPPGVQVGGAPPPPPGGPTGAVAPAGPGGMAAALPAPGSPTTVLRETQQRMPDGTVRKVVVPTPATATPPAPPVGGPATAEAAPFAPYQIAGPMQPPPASSLPPRPVVAPPAAQPPAEAGWGAGTRATGYGGGSPPPGVVPPATPAAVPPAGPGAAPPAATPPPAMAAPPPFQMRPLSPTEAAATSYDLDPQTKAALAQRLQAATTVEQAEAVKKDEAAAIIARRNEADKARLTIEAAERKSQTDIWQKQFDQQASQSAAAEAARQKLESDKQLETLKSDQALKSQITQKTMEPILSKAEAAQAMLKNAQNLELFARQQGDANALWSTDLGKRANNWIVGLGGNSEWAKEAAARQSWDTLVNGMFNDVHVPGMGAQSDRETGMLVSQWGSSAQTPLDRMTQLAIIRKNAEARIADANDVQGLVENGKPASGIHDIRKNRQIFDRPPSSTEPATGDAWNGVATYNASHPMGEPYVTWAPKKGGGGVMKWARNTGDPNNPIQIMPNVDVSR